MEEAAVGAVVGATVQVVIENLISVSMKEIKLVRDFEKELEKLKNTLITIQNILYDAEMQQITSSAVKLWLKKLENVAFEADKVLDDFDHQLLRRDRDNTKTKTSLKKKVNSIFSGSNFCVHSLKLGRKIRDINKELELINREANSFGLQMRFVGVHALDAGSDAFGSLETDSSTVDPIFLGRDDVVSTIVEKLTSIPTEQVFSVLPIVGMGGLGKTTLVRKVFNHEKIKTQFGERIWVHVSTNFDPIIVFKKILSSFSSTSIEVVSREALLKELKEALGGKTYLLVLDDVWNQDQLKWEGFINSLAGISSMKRNGILVTTRNREVASIVETLSIYELQGLPEDNCWSIIKAKAFGAADIPLEFETIGRNIGKRCQGLPLAANVVGGVLRGKAKGEWLSIQENWLSGLEGDENVISKILKLSFYNLPSPSLKKCFAYCSIFPKGALIKREELIELWMAEGFLQPDQRSDMETVGDKFFNLLLQNSLLQVGRRSYYDGNVTRCSMHDLVHDVACSVLGFPKLNDNISDGIYQARYIGREFNGSEPSHIPKEQVKYLRTLFLKGGICAAMFSDFKCLHALILTDNHVVELPSSIRELIHLRFLDISETEIKYLPSSIGELYHLQTLRAETYRLRKLPSTCKYLISLRHLHIPYDTELPRELGLLTSLRTLPYFKVGNEEGYRIVELGSLKNLKGELKIYNLEKVHGEEEAKKAHLLEKPNIVGLVLMWNGISEGEINDENVLEGLQPHPNLKSLGICGFKGTCFPLWTLKMAVHLEGRWVGLNNLMKLRLEDCQECEEIPMLGHLPHLKYLRLSDLRNVKSIASSFYGIDNCSSSNSGDCKETIIVFPALKRLELLDMPNLIEWVELPSAAETNQPREVKLFPCLEYLNIENCKQLRNIFDMGSGLPFVYICGSLTQLKIERSNGLECLPDWLFYNNQNLSQLEISNCPNLIELPDGLHTLNSLDKLRIVQCPNLKSIPYSSGFGQSQGGLTSLSRLVIEGCKGLINLPREMVESCAPSLEFLRLKNPYSAMDLPMIINCLHKMRHLTSVRIVKNVPKLINMTISPTWDSRDYVVIVDGIWQSGSLLTFTLSGMEDWDSLPDSLQHFTALYRLELENFGIEELSEWFGNLALLQELSLSDCKKLRRLPSAEAMRRLTKFTKLDIWECPLLKQRCIEQQSDDHNSEWPKISHIPNILFDGDTIRLDGWTHESYRYLDDARHDAAED